MRHTTHGHSLSTAINLGRKVALIVFFCRNLSMLAGGAHGHEAQECIADSRLQHC